MNKLVILEFPHTNKTNLRYPDEFWSKLEKILLQEAIYNKRNLRMTAEEMLHRM